MPSLSTAALASVLTVTLALPGCAGPATDDATTDGLLYVWASDVDVTEGDTDFLAMPHAALFSRGRR